MMMRMLAVAIVVMMHEQMHQRASEQKQVGQGSQQVRAVFGKQKEASHYEKADQRPFAP